MNTSEIKHLLESYFAAVDSQSSTEPLDLAAPIAALDALSANPPSALPGRLRHYLESRSYRKAYAELGGQR